MPPAQPAPAGGGQALPDAARTRIQLVAGSHSPPFVEARWSFAHDSPVIDSWCFLTWRVNVPPNRTEHCRSSVVGAFLMATRRPTDQHLNQLRSLQFLTHEVDADEASILFHELDKA